MTDLSQSVIIPREDLIELQTAAFDNSHVPTVGERVGNTTQALVTFAGIAAAITGATWGWAKANDWLENRRHKRDLAEKQFKIDNNLK